MSVRKKRRELIRLRDAFEAEASRFPNTQLSILYLTQMKPPIGRTFQEKSHVIMLWQYYGEIIGNKYVDKLFANWQISDIQTIGIRGSEFSCYALIEGPETDLFIRMAKRAGSIFSEKEIRTIKTNAIDDFKSNLLQRQQYQESQRKPVFVENDSSLAVWLNHVLHYLGKSHPLYMPEIRIELDPFAASLSAIDDLVESGNINSAKDKQKGIENMNFNIALSFPGEKRNIVSEVAHLLRMELGEHAVFYDNYYQAELARPNIDLLLQDIYHKNSDLVVVFICSDYQNKEWCGLEWRAIRDLIKQKQDRKIMILSFGQCVVNGVFGIDGYLDIVGMSAVELSGFIIKRLKSVI